MPKKNRQEGMRRKLTLLPSGRFAMVDCDRNGSPCIPIDKLPRGIPIYGATKYHPPGKKG